MKKSAILLFLILSSSIIFSQELLTPELQSKYHMISSDELNIKGYNSKSFVQTPPPTGGVRNIAEFERNQGVIVSHIGYFGIPLTLISELSEDVLVYIVCESGDQSSINSSLNSAGVNMGNIIYVNETLDSYWARDYSPWFIEYGTNNEVGIVNFPYNRPRPNDNDLPITLGDYFDLEVFGMNLEHTGGNYMTDGMGIAASCDLVYDENPGLSPAQVASLVENYLGITEYKLVQDPLDDYIEHIDCWGKFLDVDKMLVARVPSSDYRYADFEAMADYWANQTSSYGNKYNVYRTDWVVNGNAYTNSLIMNNKVFVAFNTGSAGNYNAAAAAAYEEAMPGYEIIGISYNSWASTDALHCRTHEVPDFETLRILHYPYFDTVTYQTQFVFEADVYSFNNSNNINSVKLIYKVNEGSFIETNM
ncbi:MAG TPA: agmatine deiminase family protein, partial [Bacteroidales bacterium]|nr:agmatine deiminase family protein [Bacteroidales bacterium]